MAVGVPATGDQSQKCKEDGIDLVIMGSDGTSGVMWKWFLEASHVLLLVIALVRYLTVPFNAPDTYPSKSRFRNQLR
jgi:uncharacterized membrane protein